MCRRSTPFSGANLLPILLDMEGDDPFQWRGNARLDHEPFAWPQSNGPWSDPWPAPTWTPDAPRFGLPPRPPARRRRAIIMAVAALASIVPFAVAGRQLASAMRRGTMANPTIPARCAPPPALAQPTVGSLGRYAPPTALAVASYAGEAILASASPSFRTPANAFISTPSVASHQANLDPALAAHDPGIEQVASSGVGPSENSVYEVTNVEQFATTGEAIAYNQRIYEVRCAEGKDPNTASSTVPGEFLEPQCDCAGGEGYSEMSLVTGRFRIGVEDYETQRTDHDVADFAGVVIGGLQHPVATSS